MPSTKPKVFAYLPQELYEQVTSFKIERELNSDSQAVIAILSEYFGSEIIDQSKSNNAIERMEILLNQYQIKAESSYRECTRRINTLEVALNLERRTNPAYTVEISGEVVEETTGSVPGELEETIGGVPGELEKTTGSVPGELEETIGSVPGELEETIGSVPGELEETIGGVPGELEETTGLSQLSLAKRLGYTDRHVRKMEKEGKLKQWSKEKDPDHISWELRGKKYYPARDAEESELTSELPSMLEFSNGLSADSLARRFGVTYPYILKLEKQGEIEGFSKEADPQGWEWEFRDGQYYPKILSLHQ